jgi:hypothetical protein
MAVMIRQRAEHGGKDFTLATDSGVEEIMQP